MPGRGGKNGAVAESARPSGRTLDERVTAWRAADPDPETAAAVDAAIAAGPSGRTDLEAWFDGMVRFGTAGVRAARGPGPARMNRLTVRRIGRGVAWLVPNGGRAVVGRDARLGGTAFQAELEAALVERGAVVERFAAPVPTPIVAHRVRDAALDAGVVCTASHNAPSDSGVKVYAAGGAQLDPADEASVEAAVDAADPLAPIRMPAPGTIEAVDDQALQRYLDDVVAPLAGPDVSDASLVYTALHGVGADTLAAAFARVGRTPPEMVASQREPDGTFPTVRFPNPEEPGALDAAMDLARRVGADAVLANDPDADRLAVAVPLGSHGAWRTLTGDEVGALLAEHLLATGTGADRLVVATHVSSALVGLIAAAHGAQYVEVPTGFKWVARAVLDRPELRFVFGYEEALGYAVTDRVLDKDGISAAVVVARLIGSLRAAGSGVEEALATLAERHGLHATRTLHLRSDAADATAAEMVARVLDAVPSSDDRRVLARASGTEAMAKVYLEVVEPLAGGSADHLVARYRAAASRADVILDQLEDAVRACLAVG